MSGTAGWLAAIGLPQYVPLFEEHRIDLDVVPHLTAADLKELGIPLGDRKRLLNAISILGDTAAPDARAAHDGGAGAERRQITVVFCDVIGSTELASRLDPEDLAVTMASYQDCCTEVMDRWDGHIAEFLGDGAVIYFGWPRAHEDDAERAVLASLELVRSVGLLPVGDGSMLAARTGIATGLVVVGETKSDALAQREGVVGETPNLAARAQAVATPGMVVVTPRTRRLIGDRFDLESLGEQDFKGIAGPVEVWRVRSVLGKSRFEARAGGRLSPLVGRRRELDALLESWQTSLAGSWRSALIVGEAGIGKSRLLQEVVVQTDRSGRGLLRLQCSPYHAATAFLPFVEWIRSSAVIGLDSEEEAPHERLEALVDGFGFEREATVPLLAALLSVSPGDRYDPLRLSLKLQRERTIQLLVEMVHRTGRVRPLLMVVEDLHWADPTSLEVLTRLAERTSDVAGFLLMTARPRLAPRFEGAKVERIDLERLGSSSTLELVGELAGGKPLPASVLDSIVASADGVPLFVEELTRSLLESGGLADAGDRYELHGEDPGITVPATLHDLLVARLDRLGSGKVVAQVASTLGRSFSLELLRAVAPAPNRDLTVDVRRLREAGIFEAVDGETDGPRYAFRHTLLREAAYHSQLKVRRRELHLSVARVLETMYPGVVAGEPEVLAHHFSEGGRPQPAAGYLLKAGEKALRASAVHEAITHLSNGVGLIESLPHTEERDRTELRLQAMLGTTYMQAKGWAASEVETAYSAAARLSQAAETTAEAAWILWGIWVYHHVRGRIDEAFDAAGRIQELADSTGDADATLIADMIVLQSCFYAGRFSESVDRCESFLRAYDPGRHRSLADAYSTDLELVCLVHQAIATWILGQPDRAAELARLVEDLASRLDHPYSVAWASTWGVVPDLFLGDSEGAAAKVRRGHRIAEEHDYAYVSAMATMIEGWLDGRSGNAHGPESIEAALGEFRATGAEIVVPFFETLRAELLVEQLRLEEALACVTDARARISRWGERWQEAEVCRVEANALAARAGEPAEVEARFREALDVAVRQHARAWQLRAATDFARYLCEQQRAAEARAVLEPVVEAFAGTGASQDVSRAKRVLSAAKDQLLVG